MRILVVNDRTPEDHNESSWSPCSASGPRGPMRFTCLRAAILGVSGIKVDCDINIPHICLEPTMRLNDQRDSDNCFFYHSAAVTHFDILNRIKPSVIVVVGGWDEHDEMTAAFSSHDVPIKRSQCLMQEWLWKVKAQHFKEPVVCAQVPSGSLSNHLPSLMKQSPRGWRPALVSWILFDGGPISGLQHWRPAWGEIY